MGGCRQQLDDESRSGLTPVEDEDAAHVRVAALALEAVLLLQLDARLHREAGHQVDHLGHVLAQERADAALGARRGAAGAHGGPAVRGTSAGPA